MVRSIDIRMHSLVLLLAACLVACTPLTLLSAETLDIRLDTSEAEAGGQHRLRTRPSVPAAPLDAYTLRTIPIDVYRPDSLDELELARQTSLHHSQSIKVNWVKHTVQAPDVSHRATLAQIARMAGNAYARPGQKNWYEMDMAWNNSFPFGWEDDEDGFRGQVFRTEDNSTVVLSIKGTTIQGPTSKKDKFNDNLLFSCCCARVDVSWVFRTVCDCYAKHWRCDDVCLTTALVHDSLFYSVGMKLINELIALYPTSNIWLTGHSLGGALASLLGSTFGFPAVAFEAPGEKLAAKRLHIPLSPLSPVTHVYHTADPVPQGACTGPLSVCAQAGYALETKCHLGKSIVYDTITHLGWWSDVRHHVIKQVINDVIEQENIQWEEGREVPLAREEVDCTDCHKWEFGMYK